MILNNNQVEDILTHQEYTKTLLSSMLYLSLDNAENEKLIINTLNKMLGSANHRREGLEYLRLVINNCTLATIVDNAFTWINHCVIKYNDDILREQKLVLLANIVEIAHLDSDFNKKFVSDYIAKILDSCLVTSHANSYEHQAGLTLLTACLKYYPSWFTLHKIKIENYLLIFLDSSSEDLVQKSAVAFHYLQQVGGAGANGINHKTNFTQNFHKLCGTVQKLLSNFFEGQHMFSPDISEECFEFGAESEVSLFVLERRLRNCLKFIEIMIRTRFSVAKEIKPKKLIELIAKGMLVHKCVSKNNVESVEAFQFSLLLSNIQTKLLNLLRVFILWQKSNILMFSYPISKVIVDALERSQSCDCFKYEGIFQESVYRTLGEWIKVLKSSLHVHFQTQIINFVLKDITPVTTSVSLSISEAATKNKSAKAKRKFVENRIIASGSTLSHQSNSTSVVTTNEANRCKFALKCLEILLEHTKLSVTANLLQTLYKSVFDTLATIDTSTESLFPYTKSECLINLYKVLVAFYHQDNLRVLPPLQTTIKFLVTGINSNNRSIAEVCEHGIKILEILCQPVCPTLYVGRANELDDLDADSEEMPSLLIEEDVVSRHSPISLMDSEVAIVRETTSEPDVDVDIVEMISETVEEDSVTLRVEKSPVTTAFDDSNSKCAYTEAEINNQNNINSELESEANREERVTSQSENVLNASDDNAGENEEILSRVSATEEENNRPASEPNNEQITEEISSAVTGEEPPAKKPRREVQDKDDLEDIFEERGALPDDSLVEDDSFVDEIKEY
ncbi:uncharacterized protein LOC132696306 [Cylas formicarius]|uniref:uncharacterized protein LOC132696306 n=1 Tax=Cylas formicarius TaxID=197179 RepID=UPI0029589977|nr:uncharacterized protein LOC132696306 [Cylas formicarius]